MYLYVKNNMPTSECNYAMFSCSGQATVSEARYYALVYIQPKCGSKPNIFVSFKKYQTRLAMESI